MKLPTPNVPSDVVAAVVIRIDDAQGELAYLFGRDVFRSGRLLPHAACVDRLVAFQQALDAFEGPVENTAEVIVFAESRGVFA